MDSDQTQTAVIGLDMRIRLRVKGRVICIRLTKHKTKTTTAGGDRGWGLALRHNYLPKALTHALTPESNQLWIGRSPSTREKGVEATDETLYDAEASDASGHGSEGCGGESICRKVTYRDGTGDDE